MTEVGRISVKVTPDTEDFRRQLLQQLRRIERELDGEIPFGGDFSRLRAQAAAAANSLPDAEIDARLNTRGLRAQARAVLAGLGDTVDFDASFRRSLADLDAIRRFDVQPRLDRTALAFLRAQLRAIDARIQVTPELDARRIVIERRWFGLGKIKIPVEADEDSFKRSLARLKPNFPDIKKLIPNFGTGLNPAGYAVVLAGILAVAAPLVGLLTSALLTLPGLISAVGIPIAAITLGLDGFKKAAEAIKEPFDALRASLSAQVQSQFAPVFEQLAKGFPILERAMPRVTQGLADIANSVTTFLTEGTGASQLEQLIGGIGDRLSEVAPGVRDFTAALLGLANQFVNGGALEGVGKWFNDTMADFKNWVAEMSASGELDAAFQGLGASLKVIADALGKIALEGLDFITDPGKVRGFTEALSGLGEVLKDIVGISESLAPAFKLLDLALKIPSVAGVIVDMGNRGREIGAALGDGVEAGLEGGFKLGVNQIVPPDVGAAVSEQIKNQITVTAEQQKQALRSAFTGNEVDAAVAQQLTQQVTAAIQGAKTAMMNLGPELQAQIDTALLPLATVGDRIGQVFTTAFGNLSNTVGTALLGAVNAATTAGTNIVNALQGALFPLPNIVATAFQPVAETITVSMGNATTAVTTGVQAIVDECASIGGKVSGAVGDLSATLTPAGRQLAAGLESGLRAGIDSVLEYARTIAGQIAANKGPLPKDRRELIPAGEALMEGLQTGLETGLGPVLSNVRSIAQQIFEAFRDVFGTAPGALSFNFGGAGGGVGGLTSQMTGAAAAAKDFQSNLTQAINPATQITGETKAQITELSRQLSLLEQRRKELELMRFDDPKNEALKAELDMIRQQKLALGLEKDRLTYAQKYEGTVTSTNAQYGEQLKQLAMMPVDFAKTTANSFMGDFGISGQGALPALANWGIEAGSKYIFNVSNVDEAKTLWQNQVNVESRGTVGR